MAKNGPHDKLGSVVNIEDLRLLARRRLPKAIFDYIDGGAEDEVTMRENVRAFKDVKFRPRSGIAIKEPKLGTTLLGTNLAMPLLLAPCGLNRLVHPNGDRGAAKAAVAAGVGYVLSTASLERLEDVAEGLSGCLWYQLYLIGGRHAAEAALKRAASAGFSVLVITIDTGWAGLRERDVRNDIGTLLAGKAIARASFLPQLLMHPKWLARFFLNGPRLQFSNIILPDARPMPIADTRAALSGSVVSWADLEWLRQIWLGPIVVKGVLTSDDAERAVECGCAGIIVSNHGGRQMDGVQASLVALREVVAAVHGRAVIMMDGGIRRGSDILKAMCLGANAILIGRAYCYGLGAEGEEGVLRALTILRSELETNLALLGFDSLLDVQQDCVEL